MAYIKEEILKDIRSKADIVDIISGYLTVTKKGKNYVAVCPFHDDHSPSLTISREKQIFNCFTCRTGGNVFSFVEKYENVDFVEAVEIVAKKIGYPLKGISNNSYEGKTQKELEIMDFAMKYYKNNLLTSSGKNARDYLTNRGINEAIINEFNIGLSSNLPNAFFEIAKKKGWSIDTLDKLGLINKYDDKIYDTFNNRIMIPIENIKGQVVGFTGRIYNGEENTAKYINTRETIIFKKGEILFNYHNAKNAIKECKSIVIVEGNMDAISLSARGIKNVVALMGTAITDTHINILKKLKIPIILMLDSDNAGEAATQKNGDILLNLGFDVRVVRLSDAKDPDEYIRLKGVDTLNNNIKNAIKYLDYKLDVLKNDKNLNNTEDTVKYVREVLASISNLDELTKEVIKSKLSKDYNIDINILKKLDNTNKSNKEINKENREIKSNKRKDSKYELASKTVLYYMLMDSKYIIAYKERLGYFKNIEERTLASEIVYYNKLHGGIDIADFIDYMKESSVYPYLEEVLNRDLNLTDDEFNSCIDILLNIYKRDELNELKVSIDKEMDQEKRAQLVEKFRNMKKGSV